MTNQNLDDDGNENIGPDRLPVQEKQFVSPIVAAQMLDCCRTEVFNMLKSDTLTRVKRGSRTIILVSEIEALAEAEYRAAKSARGA